MLGGIFILGLLVRVLFLSSHPSGFTPDEASFGYDAYSILKTGRDQWGNFLPITLKSSSIATGFFWTRFQGHSIM